MKRIWWKGTCSICLVLCFFMAGSRAQGVFSDALQPADVETIAGRWTAVAGGRKVELMLDGRGGYAINGTKGSYRLEGGNLILTGKDSVTAYELEAGPETLAISGGGLKQPLKFSRQKDLQSVRDALFAWIDVTSPAFYVKLFRVFLIIAIIVLARLIIYALHLASRLLIYCDRGPLGLIFRHNKNRQMTLHSFFLNAVKYIIYFTALGFALSEFGVDYTAYLASLSVIGLAIGFGSQGLVQDFVTGFFIIFEGQFQVGDMVEISGQTGIVEELGLRMTKIRNYLGQTVCLPNRNIALVGAYAKGSLEAYADIALAAEADFEKSKKIVNLLGKELYRQFPEIIISPPMVREMLQQETGEVFLRAYMQIWPQQQWVVEQQFIPRLKNLFTRENIAIPDDRIILFYHEPKRRELKRGKERK